MRYIRLRIQATLDKSRFNHTPFSRLHYYTQLHKRYIFPFFQYCQFPLLGRNVPYIASSNGVFHLDCFVHIRRNVSECNYGTLVITKNWFLFFLLLPIRLLPNLTMSNNVRNRNCLSFTSTWSRPGLFGGVRLAHLVHTVAVSPVFSNVHLTPRTLFP